MLVPRNSTDKEVAVKDIIEQHGTGRTIIFASTKRLVDKIAMETLSKYGAESLHGDIAQSNRERVLAGFRAGKFPVLVATDVAARGIDIPEIDLVIHFDFPQTAEAFVHRSGRTGRAGRSGKVFMLYSVNERHELRSLSREIKHKFTPLAPPSPGPARPAPCAAACGTASAPPSYGLRAP